MLKLTLIVFTAVSIFAVTASAQNSQPSTAASPFIVRSAKDVGDITRALLAKPGNTNQDILAAAGHQARIAIFHDENRVDDLHEVHDGSDDIYYVTNGTATLMLGGSLVEPNQISPGEWRSKTATGGQKVTIKKGDLVFVPRGTPHQRTVTDKKFTMILIKIFATQQK
jgi:mannose-6-phosphate isomerase-like protein (cupin superfamily)